MNTLTRQRVCIICSAELTGKQLNACSTVCANKVYTNRRRESGRLRKANMTPERAKAIQEAKNKWQSEHKKLVPCPVCGKETLKGAGSSRLTCSLEHRDLMVKGITFSNSKELIKPLKPKHWHGHIVTGSKMTAGTCRVCGKDFVSKYEDVTCSTECHKSRRRITGKQWMQQPEREAIYKRDNWTCGICQLPVPKDSWDAKVYQPLFPSLDHIVPVSHGGDDSADNLRLAHIHCNSLRGADMNWAVTDDYRNGIELLLNEYPYR